MEIIDNLYYKYKNSQFLQMFSLLLLVIILAGIVTYFPELRIIVIAGGLFSLLLMMFLQKPSLLLSIVLFVYPSIYYLFLKDVKILPDTFYEISFSGLLNIFIVLMTAFYFFVNNRRLTRKPSLLMPIFLFTLLLLPSFLFSPYKFLSLRNLIRILMPISFYIIFVATIKNEKQVNKILNIFIYSSFIPVFIGLWQIIPDSLVYQEERIVSGMRRIYGTFSHPNGFATFLVLILLLGMFRYFKPKSERKRSYVFLIIPTVICLFFTFTRVGWISFICSSFILFYFLRLKRKYFGLVTFALIIFLLLPSFNRILIERMKTDSSFYGRFTFNRYSLSKFREKPVFGSGLGIYSIISKESLGEVSEQYGISGGYAAHNDYFKFLVETGSLGLLGYLVLLLSIVRLGLKINKQERNIRYWGGLLIAVVSVIAFVGLTDAGFSYGGIYFWVIVAIVELKYRLANEYNDEKHSKEIGKTGILR